MLNGFGSVNYGNNSMKRKVVEKYYNRIIGTSRTATNCVLMKKICINIAHLVKDDKDVGIYSSVK